MIVESHLLICFDQISLATRTIRGGINDFRNQRIRRYEMW